MIQIEGIREKLDNHFNTFLLKVAGRLIYYDTDIKTFILAVHTTDAEKTQEVANLAWEGLPAEIKQSLSENGIGFGVKQI